MPKPRPLPLPADGPLTRLGAASARPFRSCLVPALLPLPVVALALVGLLRLGQVAQGELRDHPRYRVAFADIDCAPPAGLSSVEFLGEVQYLSGWPDDFRLLDDRTRQLADAFARHPWVERVEAVTLRPDRHVQVRLRYRTPALAVRQGGRLRAVDAHGVLLPAAAPTAELPVYEGMVAPPRGPAGTPWGDPALTAAAAEAVLRAD